MTEQDREFLEYLIEKAGDDLDKTADKINILGKSFETLTKDAETYKKGI
jgi:hypothetical protein